ncbi:MAG: hypothetical protein GAK43_01921 [Stenotrophomonas maltophilia]|nr:MAG: hypothetical protein GAK43_01921 [Stenotrophomonas maltophilia]
MDLPSLEAPHPSASALLDAAARGDDDNVRRLLAEGVPVDISDTEGSTPLLLATAGNHLGVAQQLIEAGADVNRQNQRLDSAYLLAGASGHLAILRLTLAHGADLRSTNRYGGTALIPACERGHIDTVRTLLQAGVDPNHINNLGWTGLLEAILLSDGGPAHQAIVELLLDGGANPSLADGDGITPLQHARQRGQQVIVARLQAAGAH